MLKRHKTEILEMKNLICQVKNIVESLNNRLGKSKERLPEL